MLTVLLVGIRDRVGCLERSAALPTLVVVGTAAIGGLWPALAAAVASSLLTNYYFVPPIHTWTIAEPEHLFAIFVFVRGGAW